MTAREKLAMEYPERINHKSCGGCTGCPDHYDYLPCAPFCEIKRYPSEANCANCWDREIPEEMKEEKENYMSECYKETMCTTCIHQDVCSLKGKFLDAQKAVDGLVVYDELPTGLLGQVKLRDIGFIKPVELECVHYVYKGSAGVKGGFHV